MRYSLLVVFVLTLSACSDLGQDTDQFPVSARVASPELIITNSGNKTAYTFVVGQNLAARINWAPFCNSASGIQPSETRRVNFQRMLDEGEERAIIFWWNECSEQGEALVGTNVNSLVVQIR